MIVTNLIGGLGNQMFQYAAARALAHAKGQALYLDLNDFTGYRLHHGFELARVFDCPAEVAEQTMLVKLLGWRASPLARRLLCKPKLAWLRGTQLVVEPNLKYWPGFFDSPANCYLLGYWQSEKYFISIANIIRQDFTFRAPLSEINCEFASQIADSVSVSLHIRRGDYVSDAKTRAIVQTCSLDYYRNAVNWIADKVAAPHFFVFSDAIAWAKENLKIPYPCQFISHNQGKDSYIDMHLMSLCKHNIIANSSFSWWGAWLNANPHKIVVAPHQWFVNKNDASDLLPQDWVAL